MLPSRKAFWDHAEDEVCWAVNHYPTINSLHEGYAVIKEELDEVWDEIRKKPDQVNSQDVYNELVQVAAMAARIAIDCTR